MRLKFILLLISISLFKQSFALVSVGTAPLGTPPGSGICDYTTIQAALNSGADRINVLNNQDFVENLVVDYAVDIVGGFASCQDANFNLVPTETNTTIKGTDTLGESVVRIETIENPTIKLINLNLKSAVADDSVPNGGHGLKIDQARADIWLINTNISLNNSALGAGIYMKNTSPGTATDLTVILENSTVSFNIASEDGGGIFCGGSGARLSVDEDSFVGANMAVNGGGIYAESGCGVVVSAGVDVHNSSAFKGVMYNNASGDGGGIFAYSAYISINATAYQVNGIRDSDTPATVAKNTADHDGGGIYAVNGSSVTVKDALIEGNSAGNNGGGFYVASDLETSTINLDVSNRACWNDGACMEVSNNKARLGGVVYLKGNSAFSVQNSYISGNRADIGTVTYGDGDVHTSGASVGIIGSYIYNNGNNGAGGFTDEYAFYLLKNATLGIRHSTIADNDINSLSAIIGSDQSYLSIRDSIIRNAETVLDETNSTSLTASCLIVNEDNSISGSNIYVLNPGFVDANNQNYHIHSNSHAIDLCDSSAIFGYGNDTDGNPRAWDDPFVDNVEGSLDAGADEYFVDLIFADGFED